MATTDINTQDERPTATQRATEAAYGQSDQQQVKLLTTQLDEAGAAVGPNKAKGTQAEKDAYNKLHSSFRILMDLRGQAFLDGFYAFVAAAQKHKKGIFYQPLVTRYADVNFPDSSEREVFVIFINMIVRFAGASDKRRWLELNKVSRVTDRVTDRELASLLAHAFGAA